MTYSPARAHLAKIAAKEAAKAKSEESIQGSEYELKLAALDQQRRSLSSVQSLETKTSMKAEYLQEWQGYIDTTLAEDSGAPDPIISRLWVWLLDTCRVSDAIAVGHYLLKHSLSTPEGFNRSTADVFAEEIADAYFKDSTLITTEQLLEVLEAVADYDIYDLIHAKLHRAVGESLSESEDNVEDAIVHLNRALELNPKAGCKKLLDKLQKQLEQENKN